MIGLTSYSASPLSVRFVKSCLSGSAIGILTLMAIVSTSHAQFPGGGTRTFLTTDTAVCDPDLGTVEVNVDAFGALGSALGSTNRHYNPFEDIPDQGYVSTIFEWPLPSGEPGFGRLRGRQ